MTANSNQLFGEKGTKQQHQNISKRAHDLIIDSVIPIIASVKIRILAFNLTVTEYSHPITLPVPTNRLLCPTSSPTGIRGTFNQPPTGIN